MTWAADDAQAPLGRTSFAADVCFSNRPFGVKHFQTIHHHSVNVASGLVPGRSHTGADRGAPEGAVRSPHQPRIGSATHTHAFIFNLAPRRDGSWGAIVSRELYKAQKQAGATYRRALASELERFGLRLERQNDTFRVAAIPRDVERAFSKRRQAIEEAARLHGYSTPKGMELATLRTRRPKRDARLGDLIRRWQAEARALGFELGQSRQHMRTTARSDGRAHPTPLAGRHNAPSPTPWASASTAGAAAATNTDQQRATQLGSRLGRALRALDQQAGMSGVRIKLRYREHEHE